MFGIEGKHLELIHRVLKNLDPNCDTEQLGAWSILFLCCGAMAGSNSSWLDRARSSDTFVRPSDLSKIMQGSKICTSDDYAIRFSELIKEWCNSSDAIAAAEKKLEKYRDKWSDSAFLCHKAYLALGLMLNSLKEVTKEELLGFDCKTWVSVSNAKEAHYGWPELFFTAGLILTNEDSVSCYKIASAIRAVNESYRGDVVALFEHYAGYNPFLKGGKTRMRTDQLKKGVRIKLRNGYEGIVVERCDGNTLIAEVFGAFTETGSIYAHNIVAAEIDGKWVEVEMTEEQAQFYKGVKSFLR